MIGLVFVLNVQCAIMFLLKPGNYYHGFELPLFPGREVVRGFGILFLMWNVPYGIAFLNPIRFHISTWEAVFMQAIGFFGEIGIYFSSTDTRVIHYTIGRFIVFDGVGLILLIAALAMSRRIILED